MDTDKEKTADEILAGPDYFYCERFRARLKKIDCVRRQDRDHEVYSPYVKTSIIQMSLNECQECEQGKEIRREMSEDGKIIEDKIIKETDVEEKMGEKVKFCKGCEKIKPIEAFHRHSSSKDGRHYLCKVCRAEVNKDYWQKRKKGKDVSRKDAKALSEDSSKKAQKTQKIETENRIQDLPAVSLAGTVVGAHSNVPDVPEEKKLVLMEFVGEISWVYDALKSYAGEELRSIPDQAIFMLREFMRHDGMDEIIEEVRLNIED